MDCCISELWAWFKDHAITITVTVVVTALGQWFFLKFTVLGKHERKIQELEDRLSESRDAIDRVPAPETQHWISEDYLIAIIRGHPAGRKHMPDRPLAAGVAEPDDTVEGRPSRSSREMAVARALLGEIAAKYPQAKRDNEYSKEIFQWALDKRMIAGD